MEESAPNLVVRDISIVDNLTVFKEAWRDVPRANGDVSDDPVRSKRKDSGKGFKWDAVRFAHKVYSIFHCAKNTKTDWLLWMDADTVCHSPIGIRPIEMRGHLEIPVPSNCYPIHFLWDMRWGTKLPDGWSLLITHPLNRFDLPFFTMSAIQDSDRWFSGNVVSFFLRKDFEGTIPKGTPIMSMVPIKRAEWQKEIDMSLHDEGLWDVERKRNYIYGFYKVHRWIRKKYK